MKCSKCNDIIQYVGCTAHGKIYCYDCYEQMYGSPVRKKGAIQSYLTESNFTPRMIMKRLKVIE